jgi:hypothetical protein
VNFKDKFINHCKIDISNFTFIEKYRSQTRVVDFGCIKIAFVKTTIYKSCRHKDAIGKITIGKSAILEFLITDFVFTKCNSVVLNIKEIVAHCYFIKQIVTKF